MEIGTIITTILGLAGMSWIIVELLKLNKSIARIEGRLDNVEARLDRVEARLDRVEARLDRVEARLDRVEARLDNLEMRFDILEKRFDILERRFDQLPCGLHQSAINKLELDVAEEQTFLRTKFPSAQGAFSGRKSPTQLNEYGRIIYADMEGDEFLHLYGSYFLQKMECISPKTALDVESAANEVLLLSTFDDIFNQIKVKVYHYPSMDIIDRSGQTIKYDVSLADVCFALSLKLRDMYLETHPSVLI